MTPVEPRARVAAVSAAVIVVLGAGLTYASSRDTSCGPDPLSVQPERARPGATVTVSSAGFDCDRRFPTSVAYQLVLPQPGTTPVPLATVAVREDGSFRVPVKLPPGTRLGETHIGASSPALDRLCHDVESGSCAGLSARITIVP